MLFPSGRPLTLQNTQDTSLFLSLSNHREASVLDITLPYQRTIRAAEIPFSRYQFHSSLHLTTSTSTMPSVEEDIVIIFWKSRIMPPRNIATLAHHRYSLIRPTESHIRARVDDIMEYAKEGGYRLRLTNGRWDCDQVDSWIQSLCDRGLVSLDTMEILCKFRDVRTLLSQASSYPSTV